jgi:protein-disulfide isomerase
MGPEADAYGIMSTPLVVVGDEVVGRGKVVPAKKLADMIRQKLGG